MTKELWAPSSRASAGLSGDWKRAPRTATKSYVGITYLWGDEGEERGEIFPGASTMLTPPSRIAWDACATSSRTRS